MRVLKMCERAGLVKLGHVAIDARELRANASKHKALPAEQQAGMSYERMCEKDEQLAAEVEQLLRAAAEADAAEDAGGWQGFAWRRAAGGTGPADESACEDPGSAHVAGSRGEGAGKGKGSGGPRQDGRASARDWQEDRWALPASGERRGSQAGSGGESATSPTRNRVS